MVLPEAGGPKAGRPNLTDDTWLNWVVGLLAVAFLVVMLACKVAAPELYRWLYVEDGVVEWGTAIAFLLASGFASALAVRFWSRRQRIEAILYLLLAAGMLFSMLEEIDYGQRQLGLAVPEFFVEHSTKGALNIHNLKEFPLGIAFIIVGLYGAFSRLLLPGSIKRRFEKWVDLLVPPYAIAPYFLATFVLYAYYEFVFNTRIRPLGIENRRDYRWDGHFIIGKDQEPIELLLALGFLLFVVNNWQRYGRVRAPAAGFGRIASGQSGSPQID